MPNYGYLVIDQEGKEKKGSMEGRNLEQVRSQLKSQNYIIVNLEEQNVLQKDISIGGGKKIKPRDYSVFCRQIVSMLNAGIPIIDALGMLSESTENKKFAKGLHEVQISIRKGETLTSAMRAQPKIFPSMLIQLVEAGEASGSLEKSFDRMAIQFEKESKLKGMIKKAAIYPVMVCIVALIVVAIMLIKVIPGYAVTFDQLGQELPGITLAVMAVSDFLVQRWPIVLIVLVAGIIGLKWYGTTDRGSRIYGKIAIKLPIFGKLAVKTSSALFARTLSTLMGAGVPLVEALGIVARAMTNKLYEDAILDVQEAVAKGIPISEPVAQCGLFPPMVYHMIHIGEETGDIETMLTRLAEYYDEEVEVATQSVMAALEPMIILVLAVIVVIIVAAIMAPMVSMYSAMDSM